MSGPRCAVGAEEGTAALSCSSCRLQLVDLLVQYWASIPDELKQQLDLKLGLVRA